MLIISLYNCLWIFILFSFLGWVVEVVYSLITDKQFVNRGFLFGPVCPIYGFGVLLVYICLSPLKSHPVAVFFCSTLLVSLLELVTGATLERLFNQKWWDYSNYPLNFRGYICLRFSAIWGIGCLLFIYFVLPFTLRMLELLPFYISSIFIAFALSLIIIDTFFTIASISTIKKHIVTAAKNGFNNLKNKPAVAMAKISPKMERLIKAFPKLKLAEALKQFRQNKNNKK